MKKKQIFLIALSFVLAITLSIAGTVAYLTAEDDPKLNVFTIGDISIDLTEEADINGDAADPRLEAKYVDGENEPYGYVYHRVMPGDKLTKRVSVTNTSPATTLADGTVLAGKDAYVRVTVTINNADLLNKYVDDVYEARYGKNTAEVQAMYDLIFDGWGVNYMPRTDAGYAYNDARGIIDDLSVVQLDDGSEIYAIDFAKTTDYDNDYYTFGLNNWFKSANEKAASGYTAFPPAAGYYTPALQDDADTAADERDYKIIYTYYLFLEAGDTATLFEGLNVPADFDNDQIQLFQDLEIAVEAAAIQADNFNTPYLAFAALANGGRAFPAVTAKDAAELNDALAAAKTGTTINLVEGVDYDVIAITTALDNVAINANGAAVRFNVMPTAELTNVTISGVKVQYDAPSGAYVDGGALNIDAGAKVDGLTLVGWDVKASGGRSSLIGNSEPTAKVTVKDCTVNGPKYLVYGSAPMAELNILGCDISNISSWLIMENAGDAVGAKLTIDGNTFVNCDGGIAKYLGSTQPEGAATVFTNNTLTNCAGHDGSDAKWFTIPGATSTITVSGNTLDGADWVPGIAQGLGK